MNPVTMGKKWAREIWKYQVIRGPKQDTFKSNPLIPNFMSQDQWCEFAAPIWANGYLAGNLPRLEEAQSSWSCVIHDITDPDADCKACLINSTPTECPGCSQSAGHSVKHVPPLCNANSKETV